MGENRKSQQQMSPEQYIRERVRSLPIGKCYVNDDWQQSGIAMIVVERNHKQGTITLGFYLVDIYCLGVKDSFYRFSISQEDVSDLLDSIPFDMEEVPYDEVHNIIFEALEWADEVDIKPCKEWALTKYILKEDDDEVPLIEYPMGKDGKYCLVAKNNLELNTYLPRLKKHLGDDFHFMVRTPYDDMDES